MTPLSDTALPLAAAAGFDAAAARRRCLAFRRRILDISQRVSALHIAPAFSCLEMADAVYYGLMRRGSDARSPDSFLMSKGHGCMAQFVILEALGVLEPSELERYCSPQGRLGGHPDYGVPGIEAATGSLGHGLSIALGLAYADMIRGEDRVVYALLGDGEMEEGSTWEALMMAPNLGVRNLVGFIDLNDFQGLGRISEMHPNFHPIADKVAAFGWEVAEVNGHDAAAVYNAVTNRRGDRPFMLVGQTVKGRGVGYMEHVAIWHYRSPNPAEYRQAVDGLCEVSS
jgi:transketolase